MVVFLNFHIIDTSGEGGLVIRSFPRDFPKIILGKHVVLVYRTEVSICKTFRHDILLSCGECLANKLTLTVNKTN